MKWLAAFPVALLLAFGFTASASYGRYEFSFRPGVGTPRTTFSASFRAPFTPVVAFDTDTYYDWALKSRAGSCAHSKGHHAGVETTVNRHPSHGLYGIREGDLVTYNFVAPRLGWCNGVYRGTVMFVGADVAGCPPEAPPRCDPSDIAIPIGRFSFRVTGAAELPSTGVDARAGAMLGVALLIVGFGIRRWHRKVAGARRDDRRDHRGVGPPTLT